MEIVVAIQVIILDCLGISFDYSLLRKKKIRISFQIAKSKLFHNASELRREKLHT